MSKRNPPEGGSGEARTAAPKASILMQYPDLDGNPVFFDPLLVTGIREVLNTTKGVWQTLIFVSVSGSTTQVFTVLERAQMVGDRVNMYRRGYGERLEALEANLGSGKLVIPEAMEFPAPDDAALFREVYKAATPVEQSDLDISLAEDELS